MAKFGPLLNQTWEISFMLLAMLIMHMIKKYTSKTVDFLHFLLLLFVKKYRDDIWLLPCSVVFFFERSTYLSTLSVSPKSTQRSMKWNKGFISSWWRTSNLDHLSIHFWQWETLKSWLWCQTVKKSSSWVAIVESVIRQRWLYSAISSSLKLSSFKARTYCSEGFNISSLRIKRPCLFHSLKSIISDCEIQILNPQAVNASAECPSSIAVWRYNNQWKHRCKGLSRRLLPSLTWSKFFFGPMHVRYTNPTVVDIEHIYSPE